MWNLVWFVSISTLLIFNRYSFYFIYNEKYLKLKMCIGRCVLRDVHRRVTKIKKNKSIIYNKNNIVISHFYVFFSELIIPISICSSLHRWEGSNLQQWQIHQSFLHLWIFIERKADSCQKPELEWNSNKKNIDPKKNCTSNPIKLSISNENKKRTNFKIEFRSRTKKEQHPIIIYRACSATVAVVIAFSCESSC